MYGYERFREWFTPFSSSFCLIGGSACDLLFEEAGLRFRATKDLDIVVIVDEPHEEFARALWDFVGDGRYQVGRRSDGVARYYRFYGPKAEGFPSMIELFARHPAFQLRCEEGDIAPLPVSDAVSSLSAILLDNDYYQFLRDGIVDVGGIGIVDAVHLIPLKARAHIDLNKRKIMGRHVNDRDLRKHKKDVLRLTELIPREVAIEVKARIADDLDSFLRMVEDEGMRIDQLGLNKPLSEALTEIRSHYRAI